MGFSPSVSFISEGISFDFDNTDLVKDWIKKAIIKENKILGEIAYVFCSDDYLYNLNYQHLGHDTFTDIITFNYNVDLTINADIFISIDRVKENAETFNTSFHNELCRVIIHGILHLVGYDDKSQPEKEAMRSKEDFYLSLLTK